MVKFLNVYVFGLDAAKVKNSFNNILIRLKIFSDFLVRQ